MTERDLIPFLRALCAINGRNLVPAGNIRVKYRDDDTVYEQWVPQRQTDIVEDGLLDPGFGPGPVYYSDIDLVEARLSDWVAQKGELGREEFLELHGVLQDCRGLEVGLGVITWTSGSCT